MRILVEKAPGSRPARCPEVKLMLLLLLVTLSGAVQAQFSYIATNGTITITGYTGPGGAVTIPDTINGLPVTSIGDRAFDGCSSLISIAVPDRVTTIGSRAFSNCTGLTNVTLGNGVTSIGGGGLPLPSGAFLGCTSLTRITLPNTVTNIGDFAFAVCTNLTNITIGSSVTSIGVRAFWGCDSLASVTLPNSMTSIGGGAFMGCTSLPSLTVPGSVTSLGWGTFYNCASLASVYFQGNTPSDGGTVFYNAPATVYYLPGTTGWSPEFGGRPTALWVRPNPLILSQGPNFGLRTNGFGFIISWATNRPVVVEACSNLSGGPWLPVATNALTGGLSDFTDVRWRDYPARFYRPRAY